MASLVAVFKTGKIMTLTCGDALMGGDFGTYPA
jgi:hypothetical protein